MATTEYRDSILTSTKIAMGIIPEYNMFDDQLIMLINSTFLTLQQIGIGPTDGYEIEGADETWADYLGSKKLFNAVKTFVHMDVRLHFDPPSNSSAIQAVKDQLSELTWRLNVLAENASYKDS